MHCRSSTHAAHRQERPLSFPPPYLLLVALLLALPASAAAQTGSIRGEVVQQGSGQPIVGVQVWVPGTSIASLTDGRGNFLLLNVQPGVVNVRVQMLGFATAQREVRVTPGEVAGVRFELRQSAISLDEVVVTGTGAPTERRRLGHTIGSVDASALQNAPIANVSQLLGGRVAGVVTLPSGGLAGEGTRIRIRGAASLAQSNEPIIYVDGVRIDNASTMRASRLDDINPEAIERMEILKGAAAATLYGTEASGGVIQIFTKRGSQGPARWEYRMEQGLSEYPMSAWKPHAGYARTQEQAARLAQYWGLGSLAPYQVFEVPMMDLMVERGRHSTHSLSVSGGGQSMTYFISGRTANENGPFGAHAMAATPGFQVAEDRDRMRQANANVTILPRENLRFRMSAMYTERYHEEPGIGNSIFAPYSIVTMSKPELASEQNPTGAGAFMTAREGMLRLSWQDVERFGGSLGMQYNLFEGLSLDGTFGIDIVNQRSFGYRPFGYNVDAVVTDEVLGGRGVGDRNRRDISFDTKVAWSRAIGSNFSSQFTAGGQFLMGETHNTGGSGRDFPAPGLEVASAGAIQTVTDAWIATRSGGLYAQEQLGFRDYIFATVGARFDRHSAFGDEAGGALYPKFSLSLVPSGMPGWRHTDLLSTLQLRAAVGTAGLQPNAFDKFTTFSAVRTEVGSGVQPSNVGNPTLKPEVSTEWEVGADVGLFSDRAGLEITYWNRSVRDLLVARQYAPSGGFTSSQLDNLGNMTAQGVEIGLRGTAVSNRTLSIRPFVNVSYLRQELTDLGGAPEIKVGYFRYLTWHKVGYAPGSFFGPTLADMPIPITLTGDCRPATREALLQYLSVPRAPQNIRPIINGCGTPQAGQDYLGKPTPDWTGSFGTDIGFMRNFTFSTMFEFKAGNYAVHNLGDAFRRSHALLGRNIRSAAEVESALANPASTPEQRFDAAMRWATEVYALSPFDGLNEVEKGDFIRWREASLTFDVPGSFAQRFSLGGAALTLGMRNIALFTGYNGIDPESNVATGTTAEAQFIEGTNAWVMPLPRRLTLAARFNF
jgi:TonB-dependent starch-binding outer membrane protein SusC